MSIIRSSLAACLLVLLSTEAAFPQFIRPQQQHEQQRRAEDYSDVRLAADAAVIRHGETFHLVVLFEMKPNWHIYWKNPGDGVVPPEVLLDVPDGFEVGESMWPRPKRIDGTFGNVYSYADEAAIFFPVTVPEDFDADEATFEASVAFAVCDPRKCLFGDMSRRLTLPVSRDGTIAGTEPEHADAIARQRERLPRPINEVENARAEIRPNSSELHITGPIPHGGHIAFYSHDSQGVSYGEAAIEVEGDRFTARIELDVNPRNFTGGPPRIGGLIVFGEDHRGPSYEINLPLPSASIPAD